MVVKCLEQMFAVQNMMHLPAYLEQLPGCADVQTL